MRAVVLALLLLLSFGARAEEKVVSFHSDIQIAADGWLTVTETIDVNVEGRQIQRGILRDFPTDYQDRFGRKVTVPFEVLRVTRDGAPENHAEQRKANGVSVRIGSAGHLLAKRRHVYEIRYRTRFQVGFFDTHDELYWNVNGNGWTFAMDEVAASVALPSPVPAAQIRVEAYTGRFGARGRDYRAQARDGGADFLATRRLAAGEGLTLVFMFPKGVVLPPTLRDKFDRWLDDNLGEALGAAGLLVLVTFLYWRWSAVGRDPRAGPAFPRYEPPRGFGPAAVRYVDRREYDDKCFTAALLGLAQRGFLTLTEHRGSYELRRTGKEVEMLPGDAQVAALVPGQDAYSLGGRYDPAVATARAGLAMALSERFDGKYYSQNRGPVVAAFFFGWATLAAMFFTGAAVLSMVAAAVLLLVTLAQASKYMPAYTPEGRKVMDEIDGLRQYLSVAEKDDLARQKRPPRTTEEFVRFLPYAVALGVEKTWADAFTAVLGAAAVAAAAASAYSSGTTTDTDQPLSAPDRFVESLGRLDDTISAASSPPASSSGGSWDSGGSSSSSSSSSGGGSSGGGGGGGGGSGW